jgi:hypothetical protein
MEHLDTILDKLIELVGIKVLHVVVAHLLTPLLHLLGEFLWVPSTVAAAMRTWSPV